MSYLIDGLQYANYGPEVFRELRRGNVDCIHVTIAYHENLRDTLANIGRWNQWFEQYPTLIRMAYTALDVEQAKADGVTAVVFGFQNPSPIEDDIALVEIWCRLGVRFMQLTYNNQSLLASGCYEDDDTGLTRMGREVVSEMNRVGMVIDMSHSGERSTLEAIEASTRPIAITHANPYDWHPVVRNKQHDVLQALAESGGMMGFSLYPHHLAGGTACTLQSFCQMVAETAERYGIQCLGIGSDLCQGQPDSVVRWMRDGRWTKHKSDLDVVFPDQPHWFRSNLDWENIRRGLSEVGFGESEIDGIMGDNWMRFFRKSFAPWSAAP